VGEAEGAWAYAYGQILTDYLRKPGGVRQRDISTVDQSETDQFLLSDSGSVSARIQRETNSLVQRVELSVSGTAQAAGSQQDTTISKLGLRGGYTETFSGSTEFDPLLQMGGRHYLAGLGWYVNRKGNHPHIGGFGGWETMPTEDPSGEFIGGWEVGPGDLAPSRQGPSTGLGSIGLGGSEPCPDCCWEYFVGDCIKHYGKSRYCWHQMCCCPGLYVTLTPPCFEEMMNGSLPPGFNCHKACCEPSDYPEDVDTGKNSSCGGGGRGICWESHTNLLQDPNGNQLAGTDLTTVLKMIKDLCERVHDSGCLEHCQNPSYCNCVHKFCDCHSALTIRYGYFEDSGSWNHKYPTIINITQLQLWPTLLHELLHYCSHQMGLINLETRSYACERVCSSNSEWKQNQAAFTDKWKDVEPCCCADQMPARCFTKDVGETILMGVKKFL
jgi:hypothetical protein